MERAREHFQELVKDDYRSIDTSPYFPNGLGFCLVHQANFEQWLGRSAAATATYGSALVQLRRAIVLQRERIRPNNKAIAQFQGVLALALIGQGTHFAELNRPGEATAALDEAIALSNDLYRDNPALLLHQWRLASARAERGFLHVLAGQPDLAEADFRRALEQAELLASGPPSAG